ncbi:hypothetical protein CBOM_06438 [Ceraceosorus bombacis]|uniref:Uncharacterized protein n=1 Tax=Ceraceosorus bombacis TaxID=401625 RepID=A0A0P1BKM6_9BASI|nr:hypothetical protein CBOM_06438 [Ceraceosorus bombacis]
MPRDEGIKGLGLSLSASRSSNPAQGSPTDLTPRLGSFSMNSPMATPMVGGMPRSAHQIPGAPNLHASSGRFEDLLPTSPPSASFASSSWNTDLRFEGQPHTAPPATAPSWTPRAVRAAEMERERTVQIEGGMPRSQGLQGLGVRFVLPPVSATIDPHFSRAAPQAPLRDVMAEPDEVSHMASASLKRSSSSTSFSQRSTGLTPHIEKTRLTPYSAGGRPKQGNAGSPRGRTGSSTAAEGDAAETSPALRTQSKARSDLLRESALAAAASLPFEGFTGSAAAAATASPTKPSSRNAKQPSDAMELASSPPVASDRRSVSPQGRKRSVEEVEVASAQTKSAPAASGKADLSPWGVFDLSSPNEGNSWTPLGPPVACANGKGVLGSTNANVGKSSRGASLGKGKARMIDAQPSKKSSSKKIRRAHRGEDKENASSESGDSTTHHPRSRSGSQHRHVAPGAKDVFGSATNSPALGGAGAVRRYVGIR